MILDNIAADFAAALCYKTNRAACLHVNSTSVCALNEINTDGYCVSVKGEFKPLRIETEGD